MKRAPQLVKKSDTSAPAVARVHDWLFGGEDDFDIDHQAAALFQQSEIGDVMGLPAGQPRPLMRVVRYLAERGPGLSAQEKPPKGPV